MRENREDRERSGGERTTDASIQNGSECSREFLRFLDKEGVLLA
jgi:hypothetical protein